MTGVDMAGIDTAGIELRGVSRWYGNVVAVNDITMTIGAGVTGIMNAYHIQKMLENVEHVIYEKNADIGGTWLENRYPGKSAYYLLILKGGGIYPSWHYGPML